MHLHAALSAKVIPAQTVDIAPAKFNNRLNWALGFCADLKIDIAIS